MIMGYLIRCLHFKLATIFLVLEAVAEGGIVLIINMGYGYVVRGLQEHWLMGGIVC